MAKFCDNCAIIVNPNFYNDELTFKCPICQTNFEADEEDSLRKERTKGSNIMIHEKRLKTFIDDPTTMKIRMDCVKKGCNNKIIKQIRIGENLQLFNGCVKCRTQWLN
jgi:DNA-directed RNA polymerase subunit M/transcription elongation factor TFIIS